MIEQATFKPMILRSPLNSNRNLLVIPGIMFSLSKSQGKSGEDNSTFVYERFYTFRLFGKNTHRLGIQAALFMRPRFSHHFLAVCQEVPAYPTRWAKSKMAVSPYVSRAELWLANASFRPSFRLPDEFHPSIFLKWFPGSMAKGESFSILWFLQNVHCSSKLSSASSKLKIKLTPLTSTFFLSLIFERIP